MRDAFDLVEKYVLIFSRALARYAYSSFSAILLHSSINCELARDHDFGR